MKMKRKMKKASLIKIYWNAGKLPILIVKSSKYKNTKTSNYVYFVTIGYCFTGVSVVQKRLKMVGVAK